MTAQDIIKHWADTARDDLETARILLDSKKYSQCLFFGRDNHVEYQRALR